MMLQEFEDRTGCYPTVEMYEEIERRYIEFNGDKDTFCEMYKKNHDGLAEGIQRDANMKVLNERRKLEAELKGKDMEIAELKKRIERLEAQVERMEGWTAHEISEMSQERYEELRRDGQEMTDSAAREYIADEFGFAPDRVKILREIPTYQIDAKKTRIRKNGTVSRPPMYSATDWNYIRFDCAGWQREVVNGELYEYAD